MEVIADNEIECDNCLISCFSECDCPGRIILLECRKENSPSKQIIAKSWNFEPKSKLFLAKIFYKLDDESSTSAPPTNRSNACERTCEQMASLAIQTSTEEREHEKVANHRIRFTECSNLNLARDQETAVSARRFRGRIKRDDQFSCLILLLDLTRFQQG